jgi:hypothetical protein
MIRSTLAVACAALVATACPSLPQAYCEQAAECDSLLDPVGESDDSVAVCAINQQTSLDVYRANSEEDCLDVAEKQEEYMACAVEEGCDAFDPFDDACSDEFVAWARASDDAGGKCNE